MLLSFIRALPDAGGPVLVYSMLAILIVGIVAGLLVVAAVVILIVILVRNKKKKQIQSGQAR